MDTNVNIIDLVLTFKWFDKIKSGEKTHEYRSVEKWESKVKTKIYEFEMDKKPLWLRLRRGYSKTFMMFNVKHVSCNHGSLTDLKIDKLVYDFHLAEMLSSNCA